MKIKCSVGRGIMEAAECLECAFSGENACGFDHSLLKSLYANKEDRGLDIHVTDLTKCPRAVYLDKTNPIPEMPHKLMSLYKGTAVHTMLETRNGSGGVSELELNVLGVKGRLDFFYRTGANKWRLVDYKTAKDIYIELMPYGEHEVQVNLYAFMLKEMGYPAPDEIFIQYVGMRGPYECKKCRQAVEWTPSGFQCLVCGKIYEKGHLGVALVPVRKYSDKEIREVLEHRRNLLQQAFEKKQLPAGEPGWICKYCQHECDMRGA